jgi:hypothetical protein
MEFRDPRFPNTIDEPFLITSPETGNYNCIAWAANLNDIKFWPDPYGIYDWPDDIPFEETLDAFIELYKTFGYEICESGDYEVGYIKIAIFTNGNAPKHAARQIDDNEWTSKLGDSYDVRHTLESMEGGMYGKVSQFMKKRITRFEKRLLKIE